MEKPMTRSALLAAALVLSSALAAPAMAQQVYHSRDSGWNNGYNDSYRDRRDSGFWPGEVAAGVVGGAVGTAAAIATAPLRGAYAYDDDGSRGRGQYRDSYAVRNGFLCQPGTWTKLEDGRRHICQ
jgi:hypothetical protein